MGWDGRRNAGLGKAHRSPAQPARKPSFGQRVGSKGSHLDPGLSVSVLKASKAWSSISHLTLLKLLSQGLG